MFKKIAFIAMAISLNGCTIAKTIIDYRYEYCSITTDSLTKSAAIYAIRTMAPLYPADGVCVGFEENFYTIE